jgi:hydrogenase maturation protein HypF
MNEMDRVRLHVRVEGLVQGVGFRPFIHSLARRMGLAGSVSNDSAGVTVEVEGARGSLDLFLRLLETEAPPLASIERIVSREHAARGEREFVIAHSESRADERTALISPDVATCGDCLRELFDPSDRRYRYPFINCTNCGPRFTIVRGVPYDRPATTMAPFTMCTACSREYADPADRRFHAQPVACAACGPRLSLTDGRGHELAGDAISGAARLIREGRILAVKGLGGYHLAAIAADDAAVSRLRVRKHREEKAFAIMAPDLEIARCLGELTADETRLLSSPRAPIVLVRRRADAPVARAAAPGNRYLGIMLPYTPIHHLLTRELQSSIVLTSGNVSDEPIAYRDADARERLGAIADAFLTHDREIETRTDDSVVRSVRGAVMPIRRSRGYAPRPIGLARSLARPVLACGAELKSTICVAKDRRAFVSHHLGDLENYEALRAFTEAIASFRRLFDVTPAAVAHDLHPEYLSTKWALDHAEAPLVAVQHHHAHVASCLADNGVDDRVIGVAFDGLGYGTDSSLWGGEFLVADLAGFERVGHLATVPMPGGAAAIREPWRMAASYLDCAYGADMPRLAIAERNRARWPAIVDIARAGLNAPPTSSMGRLFDAAAALLGVRDVVTYEGQAAIELEQLTDPDESGAYQAGFTEAGKGFELRVTDLVRAIVDDLLACVPPPVIAARFHNGVARVIADGCRLARERVGLETVALSGGVFQNVRLLDRAVDLLEADGFAVLRHRQVPCNDGGISLGQAVVAGHAADRG